MESTQEERHHLLPLNAGGSSGSYLDRLRRVVTEVTPLGFTAFGGPQAHIGLAHRKFVEEDRWIAEDVFVGLFALASALPGPSSTQLITGVGAYKAGWLGGLLAFLLFQVPGFVVMTLLGLLVAPAVQRGEQSVSTGTAQTVLLIFDKISPGLVAAAFAQVALASYTISSKTCGSFKLLWMLNLTSTSVATLISPMASSWVFPLLMVCGGCVSLWFLGEAEQERKREQDLQKQDSFDNHQEYISRVAGSLFVVVCVLVTLVVLYIHHAMSTATSRNLAWDLFDAFWRMGGTVFGGGQVVLPMIYNEVVARGWLPENIFLYGFALVQCMPGPMFNISVFIGAAALGIKGALICAAGLFGPGLLLIVGVLPFWTQFKHSVKFYRFMQGVNAAAAGLINAALYLFLKKSLPNAAAFVVSVLAGVLNVVFRVSAPITILLGGLLGYAFILFGWGL